MATTTKLILDTLDPAYTPYLPLFEGPLPKRICIDCPEGTAPVGGFLPGTLVSISPWQPLPSVLVAEWIDDRGERYATPLVSAPPGMPVLPADLPNRWIQFQCNYDRNHPCSFVVDTRTDTERLFVSELCSHCVGHNVSLLMDAYKQYQQVHIVSVEWDEGKDKATITLYPTFPVLDGESVATFDCVSVYYPHLIRYD
jgi:hypothetical protein